LGEQKRLTLVELSKPFVSEAPPDLTCGVEGRRARVEESDEVEGVVPARFRHRPTV
jgi:hypothetical protein